MSVGHRHRVDNRLLLVSYDKIGCGYLYQGKLNGIFKSERLIPDQAED